MALQIARHNSDGGTGRPRGKWEQYIARSAVLRAAQLYRIADGALATPLGDGKGMGWRKRRALIPLPPTPSRGCSALEPYFEDKGRSVELRPGPPVRPAQTPRHDPDSRDLEHSVGVEERERQTAQK
jgi:hypothetical protein